MKNFVRLLFVSVFLFGSTFAFSLSDSGKYYIAQMTLGGPSSIHSASNSIIQTGEMDTQVLDTLAEVMLESYGQSGNSYIDAMAWATRALGASGNPRYRTVLQEVANSKQAHKKLRKYAKKAIKQLGKGDAEQYVAGSIDLAAVRADSQKAADELESEMANTGASGHYKPITSVVVGMSQAQVSSLCGPPSATTSHMTGKQWKPFNFKGGDTSRTILLYKGQGRVIVSNTSAYTAEYRVLEVILNPSESGYP